MCDCSRSHGQPVGERSFAMTLSKSFIAVFFFIELFGHRDTGRTEKIHFQTLCSLCLCGKSQNHQVVAMHEFHPRKFFGADFFGAKLRNAARELGSVQIANADDIARVKISLAPRHAGRQ